jgi:hypothetical protein
MDVRVRFPRMAPFSGGKRGNLLRDEVRRPRKAEYPARTLRRVNVCDGRVPEMLEDREVGKMGRLRSVRSWR